MKIKEVATKKLAKIVFYLTQSYSGKFYCFRESEHFKFEFVDGLTIGTVALVVVQPFYYDLSDLQTVTWPFAGINSLPVYEKRRATLAVDTAIFMDENFTYRQRTIIKPWHCSFKN